MRTVRKRWPAPHYDPVFVLAQLRERLGTLIPACSRVSPGTIDVEWIEGSSVDVYGQLPIHRLPELGTILRRMHFAGRDLRPGGYVRSLDGLPRTIDLLEESAVTLKLKLPREWYSDDDWWLTWTHGDITPGNVIVNPATLQIAGIIDWEFMAWDLPVFDLAHALWRMVPWSNAYLRDNWASARSRSLVLRRNYGWEKSADYVLTVLLFLIQRRIEILEDPAARLRFSAAEVRTTLAELRQDYERMIKYPGQYIGLID